MSRDLFSSDSAAALSTSSAASTVVELVNTFTNLSGSTIDVGNRTTPENYSSSASCLFPSMSGNTFLNYSSSSHFITNSTLSNSVESCTATCSILSSFPDLCSVSSTTSFPSSSWLPSVLAKFLLKFEYALADFKNSANSYHCFSDTFSLNHVVLKFKQRPKRALLIKRIGSSSVTDVAVEIISYVINVLKVQLIVEPSAVEDISSRLTGDILEGVKAWDKRFETYDISNLVDFIIVIGGDGTILWTSHLFKREMPIVIGISMGSLGYLNQFETDEYKIILHQIYSTHFHVNFRCRLRVRVVNDDEVEKEFIAMNECIIDRGPSSFMATLDVYCDEKYFTTVSADGLIVATPTGSTAYSMSAGGAMVHPTVPCIIFTPICPHSLSFRPVILPHILTLRVLVPTDSRSSAWIAVDGRSRTEIRRGMSVLIDMSPFPFPMVVRDNCGQLDNWLCSLTKGLNWNQRVRQAPICSLASHGSCYMNKYISNNSQDYQKLNDDGIIKDPTNGADYVAKDSGEDKYDSGSNVCGRDYPNNRISNIINTCLNRNSEDC